VTTLMTPDELEATLRGIGAERYHNLHRSIACCMAASSTRARSRPGRSTATATRAPSRAKDASLIARDRRSRAAPRLAAAPRRSRRRHGGERRGRALAGADQRLGLDRDYVVSRRGALAATKVRGRGLCRFRARAQPARGGGVVADRAVLAQHHQRAGLRDAGGYSFVSRDTLAYFNARMTQAPRAALRRFALRLRQCEARTPISSARPGSSAR